MFATSSCCLGIEARRRVEFTGVELPALVEKAVTGSVEKAMRQPVSAVEREEGGRLSSGAEEREDGSRPVMVDSAVVEHIGVVRS
jgi:hypothetical protein